MGSFISNVRPDPDAVLVDIADYVLNDRIDSSLAYETAGHCLIDTLGCGREALDMVAVPLLFGRLTRDYHDPDKRSIANALTVELADGSKLEEVVVEYPIGYKRRRDEGMPVLVEKFKTILARRFPKKQQNAILAVSHDQKRLEAMAVNEYVDMLVI